MWATAAVVCVLAGSAASVLGARAVAHHDAAKTETSFQQGSQAIASTLKLAVQRQEELTVAASTFFAGNPKATPAEFARWVTWARTRRRYPELDALGLLPAPPKPAPVVHKPTAVSASSTGTASSSTSSEASPTPIHVSSPPAPPPPVHVAPALLLSRNTGLSIYHPISAGKRQALAITTPVYRGNLTPHTVFGRTAASVGWLREVLVPGALLGGVLVGHPGYALSVTYRPHGANRAGSSLVFTSGAPRSDAQNTTLNLHDGWTVTSFGPSAGANVLNNGDALALLIGGILCSVVLGLLVDLLGAARWSTPATAPARRRTRQRPAPRPRPAPTRRTARCPTGICTSPSPGCPIASSRSTAPSAWSRGRGATRACWRARCSSTSTSCKEVNEKLGLTAGNQLLEDRRRTARGRGAHGRYGGSPRRRRVRRAGRIGRPRGAPRLPRPAHDRGAAQTDRARQLRTELRPDREHRRRLRPLRDARGPVARRERGPGLGEGRGQGPLHAVQREHAHRDRGPRGARGRAEHRAGRRTSSSCSISRSTISAPARWPAWRR